MAETLMDKEMSIFSLSPKKLYFNWGDKCFVVKNHFINSMNYNWAERGVGQITSDIRFSDLDIVEKEMTVADILSTDVDSKEMLKAMYKQLK